VVTGTLKIDTQQMNHVAIAVSCWACRRGSRRICTKNHSFGKEVHFDILNRLGETKVPCIGLPHLCVDGVYDPWPAVPCGECYGGSEGDPSISTRSWK